MAGGVHSAERDYDAWPDDTIGDRLWEHACQGDLLTVPREITFTIDFPTVTSCATFVAELDQLLPDRCVDRVVEQTLAVTVFMEPSYEDVYDVDDLLSELAHEHDAEPMGWDFVPVLSDA